MAKLNENKNIAIKVTDLSLGFTTRGKKIHVLRDISLDIIEGETLAIVGESGSGKSVFTKAFTGMLDSNGFISSGSIVFHGQDVVKFKKNSDWLAIRGRKIATIFQDPMTSLNPLFSIGYQISEVLKLHSKPTKEQMDEFEARQKKNKIEEKERLAKMSSSERKEYTLAKKKEHKELFETLYKKAIEDVGEQELKNPFNRLKLYREVKKETHDAWVGKPRGKSNHEAHKETINLLKKVQIPNAESRYHDYPFQYSGGMRQRVVIAIALACHPEILICDEPTTALDVTVQSQIIKLIKDLQKDYHWTTIFITHDLGVVANVADRIAVMYGGQIVEYGTAEDIFYHPAHPYTWALLSSLPQLGSKEEPLSYIPGNPPSFAHEIIGDPFAERNKYALGIDFLANPPMFKISETHSAKTWLLDPRAPKVEKPKVIVELRERMAKAAEELLRHQEGGKEHE
ncbi:MAG: ATP-binding cassette domain-containing protein [Erysipelotrichaceae bacterium]|jgi:oligopeptide transport system ATP-binding protein|nr:ATP-binding cassette domain-containing protein [Erysipelotrichaceae bacterium]